MFGNCHAICCYLLNRDQPQRIFRTFFVEFLSTISPQIFKQKELKQRNFQIKCNTSFPYCNFFLFLYSCINNLTNLSRYVRATTRIYKWTPKDYVVNRRTTLCFQLPVLTPSSNVRRSPHSCKAVYELRSTNERVWASCQIQNLSFPFATTIQ